MTDERTKKICSRCRKQFENKDPLPLCPECLFGIEDFRNPGKSRYNSSRSDHGNFEKVNGHGISRDPSGP